MPSTRAIPACWPRSTKRSPGCGPTAPSVRFLPNTAWAMRGSSTHSGDVLHRVPGAGAFGDRVVQAPRRAAIADEVDLQAWGRAVQRIPQAALGLAVAREHDQICVPDETLAIRPRVPQPQGAVALPDEHLVGAADDLVPGEVAIHGGFLGRVEVFADREQGRGELHAR